MTNGCSDSTNYGTSSGKSMSKPKKPKKPKKKAKVLKAKRARAMTVGDLMTILATLDPRLKIIGLQCIDRIAVIPQDDGKTVLIIEQKE